MREAKEGGETDAEGTIDMEEAPAKDTSRIEGSTMPDDDGFSDIEIEK